MLTYKDLRIKCTEPEARKLLATIQEVVASSRQWRIDQKWMAATVDTTVGYSDGLFAICTKCVDGIDLFGVVLLYAPERRGIYVPNILPIVQRELEIPEYNLCLDEFWNAIGRESSKGFKHVMSGGEVTREDLLSPSLLRLFNEFNALANRRALHPYDERRWRNFVIRMASSRRRLDERQIRCLFLEFGWEEDKAREMASRYVHELAIVRQYKGQKI